MQKKPHLAIIFIQDDAGRYFVHQRAAFKKAYPHKYGLGAGGHVGEDESPDAGAARELREGTGLSVPLRRIASEHFDTDELYEIAHLYLAVSNDDIATDEKEWQWSGWMEKEDVDQLFANEKLCPDTAALYSKYFA